jgi:hypothetical protein
MFVLAGDGSAARYFDTAEHANNRASGFAHSIDTPRHPTGEKIKHWLLRDQRPTYARRMGMMRSWRPLLFLVRMFAMI